ncbi:hypothetical protein [Sphaerisporangium sp. NPDC051011]|uniref:hypothetical protein n=1 Tax=Sphaerisporangium sp. NPDC051011 TaxID=3155792 RepID=UPI0033F77047
MSTISPFRALLAVDVDGYGRQPDALLSMLHREIYAALTNVCERSSLAEAWSSVSLLQRPGDELVALLPVETLPLLVHPFLDHLQEELVRADRRLREHDRDLRLRLRVAVHVGSVRGDASVTAGISRAMNEVHRLLGCDPVRSALRDSDPDVTFVAAVLSEQVFAQVVEGGRTELPPSEFTKVRAKVKQFDQPAWLYVPRPSRGPAETGSTESERPAPASPA